MKESFVERIVPRTDPSRTVTSLDLSWKTCGVTRIDQLQTLAPMGLEFWSEMGMPGRFVPELWIESWKSLLRNGSALIIGLMRNNQLMGAIGGTIVRDLNDHALVAVEQFWFVTGEARGHGLRLLNEFEAVSRSRGAVRVLVGHIHAGRTDIWQKVLNRKGYVLLESHYVKS